MAISSSEVIVSGVGYVSVQWGAHGRPIGLNQIVDHIHSDRRLSALIDSGLWLAAELELDGPYLGDPRLNCIKLEILRSKEPKNLDRPFCLVMQVRRSICLDLGQQFSCRARPRTRLFGRAAVEAALYLKHVKLACR